MSNTFANIITESQKNALNRAVENHNAIEARAKDVADWYMARKAEQEEQRRRINEMERDFITRYRSNKDGFRDKIDRLRKEAEEDFRSGRYMEVGSGKTVLNIINSALRFNVEEFYPLSLAQLKADKAKYIQSMKHFANFK